MKKNTTIFLATFSIFTAKYSTAQLIPVKNQPDQYRVINWTAENGLSNGISYPVYKDAAGFIWFGGENADICRTDGSKIKKISPDLQKAGSIFFQGAHSFKEDSLHNVWIGTTKGLARYDLEADSFTNFTIAHDTADYDKSILPIWSTSRDVYCLEAKRRIVSFDPYTLQKKNILELSGNYLWPLTTICIDTVTNTLWLMQPITRDTASLLSISLSNKKQTLYSWPCFRPHIAHRHSAESIKLDIKRHSIWINSGDGLIEFSIDKKTFQHINGINELLLKPKYDRGVGVTLDELGNVWFCSYSHGIFIYNPLKDILWPLFSDEDQQQLIGNENLNIYSSGDGIMWVNNWSGKGLFQLVPKLPIVTRYSGNPAKKDSLSSSRISNILLGPKGKLWLGTADGINIFDQKTDKFEVLREKDLPGVKGNCIIPMCIDTIRGKAWISAGSQENFQELFQRQKIYEMDLSTKVCREIDFRKGNQKIGNHSFVQFLTKPTKKGILIVDENNGIFELTAGSLTAELILDFPGGVGALGMEDDRFLFLQSGGSDRKHHSFAFKNGQWEKIFHSLDTLNWLSILRNENDKSWWVGFSNKIIHYDRDFNIISTYGDKVGVRGFVEAMCIDDYNNIWYVTNFQELARLNTTSGYSSTFNALDGYFKHDFIWYPAMVKDYFGQIYLGIGWNTGSGKINTGLDRIYPDRVSLINSATVYLDSLLINSSSIQLNTGLNNLTVLKLSHSQNSISIEPGIIDFYSIVKGQIRYKLESEGKKAEWQILQDKLINFYNLTPGNYRLVIQASTGQSRSEFNSPEKILSIIIKPPFWETWWFRILSLFVLALVVWGIMRSRAKKLRLQNIQLEEKVMARTVELKHSLEALRDSQQQLIQQEKMASLGELTAGIAHEIQNPLNFVNNFSEVSAEMMAELKNEVESGDKEEILRLADEIEKNLSKISHHGKRADAIVKGMLQHSRTDTGQKEPTNINALAEEYLRLAYHGQRAKDKEFNVHFESDLDPSVGKLKVVPQQMGRVLHNIYSNAFYAVNERRKNIGDSFKPSVKVTTQQLNGTTEIRIKDNGGGMPQKIVDKIFQPFFTTKPTGDATGLGLSLSYDIITKGHGGDLKVNNIEGEGAEFIIRLPSVI